METFQYLGLIFEPFRLFTIEEKETDFNDVLKHTQNIGLTPEGWNYEEFYEVAKKNNADVDLFKVKNTILVAKKNNPDAILFEFTDGIVIPTTHSLLKYEENI